MLLPLGLGLRFPRIPYFTLLLSLGLVCFFILDLPNSREISKRIDEVKKSSALEENLDTLVMAYCKKQGLVTATCEMLTTKHSQLPSKDRPTLDLSEQAKALKVMTAFVRKINRKDAEVTALPAYKNFDSATKDAEKKIKVIHKQFNLLSPGNPTTRALSFAQLRHSGFLHLLSNIFAFIVFGSYVEMRIGALLFLMTYILGGFLGLGGHLLSTSSASYIVGASANISAIMGMFFVVFFDFRMKFLLYMGWRARTFFGQVSIFFPILYIASECLPLLQGSAVGEGGVAHSAHLIGLCVGMVLGWIERRTSKLKWPFIYPEEPSKTMEVTKLKTLDEKVKAANWLISRNPENLHVRILVCGEICHSVSTPSQQSLKFLYSEMATCASLQIRSGKLDVFSEMLDALPVETDFAKLFAKSGRKSLIRMGDYALDTDNLALAIRIFDAFMRRFPGTPLAAAVRKTVFEILSHMKQERHLKDFVKAYIRAHPAHRLPLVLAPVTPGGRVTDAA